MSRPQQQDEKKKHIGHIGAKRGKWDNGLYTTGLVGENEIEFLIDSGSTITLLSYSAYMGIPADDKTRTTSMRPQANGTVERFNRTLVSMLTMYCKDDQKHWDQYLPQVMMAYRASRHASTGKTPNLMMLGREVTLPMQAVIGRPITESDEEPCEPDVYVQELQRKLDHVHCMARKCLKQKTDYQKRYYDLTAKKRTLKAGQLVWVYDTLRKAGVCQKLTMRWKGPFLITRRIDDVTYMVKKSPKQPAKVHHIDRLRKYEGLKRPAWC